jgi:hypothetical protein
MPYAPNLILMAGFSIWNAMRSLVFAGNGPEVSVGDVMRESASHNALELGSIGLVEIGLMQIDREFYRKDGIWSWIKEKMTAKKVEKEEDKPDRSSTPLVLTEEEQKATKARAVALVEQEEIWAVAEAVRRLREEGEVLSVADVDESTKEIAVATVRELGATEVDNVIMELKNFEEMITKTAEDKVSTVAKKLLKELKPGRSSRTYTNERGVWQDASDLISRREGDVGLNWNDVEGDPTLTYNTRMVLHHVSEGVSERVEERLKEKLVGKDWKAKLQVATAKSILADDEEEEEAKVDARATLARLSETEEATEEQVVLAGTTNVVVGREVRIWEKDKMNIKVLEMMRAMTKVALKAMRNAMKKK